MGIDVLSFMKSLPTPAFKPLIHANHFYYCYHATFYSPRPSPSPQFPLIFQSPSSSSSSSRVAAGYVGPKWCRIGQRKEQSPLHPHKSLCSSSGYNSGSIADVAYQELEVKVVVSVEENSDVAYSELEGIVRQLEIDGPMAVKMAATKGELLDVGKKVQLSVQVCDDKYIRKLNKQWLGQDTPTDVLSFSHDQLPGSTPLLLWDIIISAETAARQAQEKGHTFLHEVRILLVQGILDLLYYGHEKDQQTSKEMESEGSRILQNLGWKGKDTAVQNEAKGLQRQRKPRFKLLFCDLDGTLLNSSSKITKTTAEALRAAIECGVQVVIATGKTRPAAIAPLRTVGLEGVGGAISLTSPGVFLQGLLVYGRGGSLLHRQTLDPDISAEGFIFSKKHEIPLCAFCGDTCVTPFRHPLVEALHTVYYEPKAEVIPKLEDFKRNPIQKLLLYGSSETVANFARPHWLSLTKGRARVVQALPEMLEVLPEGASKGAGINILLDDLRVSPDEVMAIGDGENDIEMLKLAGFGVVMGNGAAQTIAVADAKVRSNDEDGVAEAIEQFILP